MFGKDGCMAPLANMIEALKDVQKDNPEAWKWMREQYAALPQYVNHPS
jgi:hypothetical protein